MRTALKKFTEFTRSLLPHETAWLLSVHQLKDEERLRILQRIDYNARHIDQFTPYDTSIDKRKYSHLKQWIQDRLHSIDVDVHLRQILAWEQKINTDSLEVEEERRLCRAIRQYRHPHYFFSRFYELVAEYRHFLLIRLRYEDYELVEQFLECHRNDYRRAKEIKEQLHQASLDIVAHYAGKQPHSKQWIPWLSEVFFDESLEGHIRYLALVRLVFICHNYRQYDILRDKFAYLNEQLAKGHYYSKRLLLNYYSNRLMLHSHFGEYDKAVYYGYLSIRAHTYDRLLYVNNLCAVLLRLNRFQEALNLMRHHAAEAKRTQNLHNRIGFVAFYMKTMTKNGLHRNAAQYGEVFLKVYAREVMQYRWQLFFSVLFEALCHEGAFEKILRMAGKYRLLDHDRTTEQSPHYLPLIPIYVEMARLMEGLTTKVRFHHWLQAVLDQYPPEQYATLRHLLEGLLPLVPEIAPLLKRQRHES
ncbi:MAG: hypothetical protein D6794_08030 [Deltaproteobacteria bacterium]|nr:MAG: hypothetical protein D6794_08030 [Deltaproteobacteria bacterium]